jgi:signal transduction histidine kinase
MATLHSSTAGAGLEQLAARLRAERHGLVRRWRNELNDSAPHAIQPHLDAGAPLAAAIAEIAERLLNDAFGNTGTGRDALDAAALLGDLRHTQGMPIGGVADEWHALEDVLLTFIREEAQSTEPPIDEAVTAIAERLVQTEIRTLERRALESYAAGHERTIEGLTVELRRVARVVIHEVRRPLAVLRVLARTLTVKDGDVDAVRMVEILDRNVARLADVTRELDGGPR